MLNKSKSVVVPLVKKLDKAMTKLVYNKLYFYKKYGTIYYSGGDIIEKN